MRVLTRHAVPDEVLSRDEALAEAQPLARIPSTPFAFIWFLVRTHYAARISVLVGLAALGAAIDAFGPLALSHLINAITAAVQSHARFADSVLPWVALFGLIWISAAFIYRGYEWIDVDTSPRMRALAQKYLFAYLLGHSPRYFQENFAGKLGQKIKQAGQATVSILNILCLDMVRVSGLVIVGGILMFRANAVYAAILMAWTVLYLGIVVSLARRCVLLSKDFSEEVSTSTGRLIDAITNADLVRAFAKAAYERRFLSFFLTDEMNASRRLRRFLIVMRTFMQFATLALLIGLLVVVDVNVHGGNPAGGSAGARARCRYRPCGCGSNGASPATAVRQTGRPQYSPAPSRSRPPVASDRPCHAMRSR